MVDEELGSAVPEPGQIGVRAVEGPTDLVECEREVRIVVESPEVPVRVLEDHVLEEAVRCTPVQARERSVAGHPRAPTATRSVLAARHEAGEDHPAGRVARARPDVLDGLHLRRREAAVVVLAVGTGQRRGIEAAGARIVQHAVR